MSLIQLIVLALVLLNQAVLSQQNISVIHRYKWLEGIFRALLAMDKVPEAQNVLNVIKELSVKNPALIDVEKVKRLEYVQVKNERFKADAAKKQMAEININQKARVKGACASGLVESRKEFFNDIFNLVLEERLQEAKARLDATDRNLMYKSDYLVKSMELIANGTEPCVNLWKLSWGLKPFGMNTILQTYIKARRQLGQSKLSADQLRNHQVFAPLRVKTRAPNSDKEVKEFPNDDDIIDRILLSIGNEDIASLYLQADPSLVKLVTKCRARKPHLIPIVKVKRIIEEVPSELPVAPQPPVPLPQQTRVVYVPVSHVPQEPVVNYPPPVVTQPIVADKLTVPATHPPPLPIETVKTTQLEPKRIERYQRVVTYVEAPTPPQEQVNMVQSVVAPPPQPICVCQGGTMGQIVTPPVV